MKRANKLLKIAEKYLVIPVLFSSLIFSPIASFAEVQKTCWNDSHWLYQAGGNGDTPNGPPDSGKPDDFRSTPKTAEPVDVATGAYSYEHQDIFIPSRGLPLEIIRSYDGLNKAEGPFGFGWSHNYNIFLFIIKDGSSTYFVRKNADGSRDKFVQSGSQYLPQTPGCHDALTFYQSFPDNLRGMFLTPSVVGGYQITTKYGVKYLFDLTGKLYVISDRNDNRIRFEYDANGLLTRVSDLLGRWLALSYTAGNKISCITDFFGRKYTYSYNSSEDLTAVTTPELSMAAPGLTTAFAYDERHNLISITDAKNARYLVNYFDSNDRVTRQTYGNGDYYFTYKTASTVVTDRKGFKTEFFLNDNHTLASKVQYTAGVRSQEPSSYTTAYVYNADKQPVLIAYPRGNSVNYQYDGMGNVIQTALQPCPGSSESPLYTVYSYDPNFNFIKTITSPKGNLTGFDYDQNGNLIKMTLPAVNAVSPVINYSYNGAGQVATVTDAKGVVTKYDYYADTGYLNRITRDYGDTTHINAATSFVYDNVGNVVSVTDARGNTSQYLYDPLNRVTRSIAPSPFNYQVEYTYDENGNVIKESRQASDDGASWQTKEYTYDILDHPVTIKESLDENTSVVTVFGYDANENLIQTTDAEGNISISQYDERDLLYKATDALGNVTAYNYDPNAQLSSITDARGKITTFGYDDFNRRIKTAFPDGSNEQYGYDPDSNLSATKTRKDSTILYYHDALNRLTKKDRGNSDVVQYSYDIGSRLLSVVDASGTLSYDYDNLDRMTKAQNALGTVRYEYDPAGNRTKLTYPDGTFVTYDYDQLGRLADIKDQALQTVASYTYDALSRRSSVSSGSNIQSTYQYDNLDRLVTLANKVNGSGISSFAYTYDKVGNRKSMVTNQGTHNYSYDSIYQLKSADYPDGYAFSDESYTYDASGSRVTTTNGGTVNYTANDLNQYTQVGANTYSYDADGNMLGDGTSSYTYDPENRLLTVTKPGTSASYQYDAFGRRIAKTANGTTTKYLYDGDQLIAEYDSTNTLIAKYTYGTGIDEIISMARGGQVYNYHYDGLGSVTNLTDSTGAVVESYSYDAWGKPATVSSIGNSFMFTGREYDPETSLYYYRARYYSPDVGRFLQTDPVGYVDSMNLYKYCSNNPINYVDPQGNIAWIIAGGMIGSGVNVVMTIGANGWHTTPNQLLAAAANGFISGAVGAVAGPLGGSLAASLGLASGGAVAIFGAGALSALGGGIGQGLANAIDKCHKSSMWNSALLAGLGGGIAKLLPTKNLNTWSQAVAFGAKTIQGLFQTTNAWWNLGSYFTSAGVGGAANFIQ